jgi:hypothetical protein
MVVGLSGATWSPPHRPGRPTSLLTQLRRAPGHSERSRHSWQEMRCRYPSGSFPQRRDAELAAPHRPIPRVGREVKTISVGAEKSRSPLHRRRAPSAAARRRHRPIAGPPRPRAARPTRSPPPAIRLRAPHKSVATRREDQATPPLPWTSRKTPDLKQDKASRHPTRSPTCAHVHPALEGLSVCDLARRVEAVLDHAIRHLAWLSHDDPAISWRAECSG